MEVMEKGERGKRHRNGEQGGTLYKTQGEDKMGGKRKGHHKRGRTLEAGQEKTVQEPRRRKKETRTRTERRKCRTGQLAT